MKKNLKKAVVLFSAICMISTSTEYFLLVNRSYSASAEEEISNSIEYLGESGQYKASSNSKEISVSTYEDLKEAIDNKDISTIFITEDIEFEDTIDIKRSLNIVGKDGKKELLFKYKEDHTSYGLENLFFIIDEKDESENEITVKLNNLKVKGEYREEIVDRSSGNGGISSGGSGGIVSKGNIEIKDCIFSENIGKFGALYGFKEILLEGDNLFENNRSISEGGAICGGPSILDESYNSISNYTESDDEWNNLQLETSKNNKSSLIIKGDTSFVYNTALGHRGAISNTRVKISKESNVIFKENSSWIGGGAIADSISNHAENREDLKNIDIEGSALFENNTSYIGGAIFGSGIKTGERADVRFVNNISELLGGSMYVASDRIVDLSNKEGVLFKIDNKISEAMETSIITKSHGIEAFYGKYKHGLFIATSGKTNNIKNSSFVNESDNIATKEASLIAFTGGNYEKDSMIFDDNYVFSNEIKDNISFMQVLSPLD